MKESLENENKQLFSREELAKYFNCHLSTIHNWTKKGLLTSYCANGRVYYKMSDLELALMPTRKNLKKVKMKELLENEKLFTREEVAKYLNCNLSTIQNLTKKGMLISYCENGRIYYKVSDIESALIANRKK